MIFQPFIIIFYMTHSATVMNSILNLWKSEIFSSVAQILTYKFLFVLIVITLFRKKKEPKD